MDDDDDDDENYDDEVYEEDDDDKLPPSLANSNTSEDHKQQITFKSYINWWKLDTNKMHYNDRKPFPDLVVLFILPESRF